MEKRKREEKILPKIIGADTETGNFITGIDHPAGNGMIAARMLLRAIPGIPADSDHFRNWQGYQNCFHAPTGQVLHYCSSVKYGNPETGHGTACDPQDVDRRFIAENGGGAYIDLNHLELCIPEVLSARDYVKYNRAMHELASLACSTVNARLADGQRIHVHANNSDGLSNSYGSHMNFLISRRCFDNIFNRRLRLLLFLASYQSSSIIFTGQGKVGSENGHEWVDFQLSQRADFFETEVGQQTTFNRPLVNSRDESHARTSMARLHVIFYDNALCQTASFLKAGVMQIILCMLEAQCIDNELILDDALQAVSEWSRDWLLRRKATTLGGKKYTAVEHQLAIYEEAQKFVASGRVNDGIVPDVHEILSLWGDTLKLLESRDFKKLSSRLDWVLKRHILECTANEYSLSWRSPEMKHLDLLYSSLDKEKGLFWQYEKEGVVERIASEEEIARCASHPPENTRAWFRSYLLKKAPREMIDIESVNWDSIVFRFYEDGGIGHSASHRVRVNMDNPLGFTKTECSALTKGTVSLHALIRELGEEISPQGTIHTYPLREI